ncbi:hypothetical protein ALC62_13445 [Cyphomyrmex costatus]|uniref:Uncharacterized protein n=1 Tax=Cyphomyrmex costatus TaxID=456900 RepID=A0A195C553_9HYME|nr:hypothetical protein ALC62_13445 [Cyphomyrmex costatus]
MAAIQRRKTSAAKRNLASVLVSAVLVVAGSKLPPAGLLRYARFSWKIARLPAPSHYARRACDSNYVNTARVEYATTRRITLGQACPTTRLPMRGRRIRQGKLTDTPRTVRVCFPHTPSGVCAFFVPYFRVKEKSRDKLYRAIRCVQQKKRTFQLLYYKIL